MREINQALSAEAMQRYDQLVRMRQDESLSREDFAELDRLTNQLEQIQVRRLEALARLAELRRIPLTQLMGQLEIQPPDVL